MLLVNDHDGVLEVHHPSVAVRDAPVVQDLEQDVEHVRVRLLDLVKYRAFSFDLSSFFCVLRT